MKKWLLPSLLLASTASFGSDCRDLWCLNHHVDALLDYGILRRSEVRNLTLVRNAGNNKKELTTEDLVDRMKWESAGKVSLAFNKCDTSSIELLYYYVLPWEAKKTVRARENLTFPFDDQNFITDFTLADEVTATYKSQFQNGEVNFWGHVTPPRVNYFSFSWVAGLRTIRLRERFKITFAKATTASDYRIRTRNPLYGVQAGFAFNMNPNQCWTWTLMLKGAGFINDARNKVTLKDQNNSIKVRSYSKRKYEGSWLLEGYGQLAYHMNSHLGFHVGYMALVLSGLALAPEQIDPKTNNRRFMRTNGQIIVDGAFAGVDFGF